MGTGRRSVPGRPEAERAVRRKRRRQTSERASLIPKSTLSEIFDPDNGAEPDEELEFIEVEPEEPVPPKRAPWWSVHPVPAPPRRASSAPPPLRRSAAAPTQEVPLLDSAETPLTLSPPPVFQTPTTDAPLVSASEPVREREQHRFPVRVAAVLFVLGASVVFGLGLGRTPGAGSAPNARVSPPKPATEGVPRTLPAETLKAPPAEPAPNVEATPSGQPVLSLDEEPASVPSALRSSPQGEASDSAAPIKPVSTSAKGLKPGASSLPPFDSALAAITLNEAAQRAGSCRSPSDPRGAAMVMLKFAPSGRVTTSVIEGGPFAGTTVGGCIALAFRGARVPAFSGEPVTLRKTLAY